jgi:pimeloyl-ACP methyl ester carboxylesterase
MNIHVNGVDLYYEEAGNGSPVILLHGNGEDHSIFDVLLKDLSKQHKVFLIDTRGHGKSQKVDSFHYSDIMEDVAAFINVLGIEKPVLYGFSDGGIVGIMLASRYPDMLSRLIASGANLTPKDLKPGFRTYARLLYFMKRDPLLRLMLKEPAITKADLARISIPTMITVGEKDIVTDAHARYIADNVQNGKKMTVPGEDHSSYIVHSEKLFPIISEFIDREY